MVSRAEERKVTGQVARDFQDALEYLGVNHFFNLFEKYYSVLFEFEDAADARADQQRRQSIMGWIKGIKDVRDPLMHPISDDVTFDDAFRVLDDAHRVLRHFDDAAAQKIQDLKENLFSEDAADLDGYIPPRDEIGLDFVGRQAELTLLSEWLGDPDRRRWALMGDGGKGKTAVAYEFARRVRETAPQPLQYVIWLSAKRRKYLEGAVQPIVRPDFTNLETALDWILDRIGWGREEEMSQTQKQELVIQLLDSYPSLIILDDVDSLEGEDELAIEFFTADVPGKTKSTKVLVTSRRRLTGYGATTTTIGGFSDNPEGHEFLDSRIAQFKLDPLIFTPEVRKRIFAATDGSPLFIEDLLRFAGCGQPIAQTIQVWASEGGDEARRYALKREIDLLGDHAREVLVACSINSGPVSWAEIRELTGLGEDAIRASIDELQRLFLVPSPRLIEDVERFDLNYNTRTLVRELTSGTELFRRIAGAADAVSGEAYASRRRREAVSQFIRQAIFLAKADDYIKAEGTLHAGLQQFPNEPSLLGQLGWLYRQWRPAQRVSDARDYFERAAQLRCRTPDMYWHWADMEVGQREWHRAIGVADIGMKNLGQTSELLFWRGYARSRAGKDLALELQPRSIDLLAEGERDLRAALRDPSVLRSHRERLLNSRIYRALALNMEVQLELSARDTIAERRERNVGRMRDVWRSWLAEHPDDSFARSESSRLNDKIGLGLVFPPR
jgi:hypothetical protein